MISKCKFTVENETQIFPGLFRKKQRTSNRRKVKGRGIKCPMQSREVKNISFPMFDNKTKFQKKRRNDIIATKKICVQM